MLASVGIKTLRAKPRIDEQGNHFGDHVHRIKIQDIKNGLSRLFTPEELPALFNGAEMVPLTEARGASYAESLADTREIVREGGSVGVPPR